MVDRIFRWVDKKLHSYKINLCYEASQAGKNVYLENAKVLNYQNNRQKITISEGSKIRGELLVFANGGKIAIGKNCYLGENSKIWSADSIEIGDNVLISHNVNIHDTNSHEMDHELRAKNYELMLLHGHPTSKGEIKSSPIVIEDYVWIGFNVIILKGVRIGKGAIISPGTVVVEDVEEFCVVGGNPAKLIKRLKK